MSAISQAKKTAAKYISGFKLSLIQWDMRGAGEGEFALLPSTIDLTCIYLVLFIQTLCDKALDIWIAF